MKYETRERLLSILTVFAVIIMVAGIVGMAVTSITDPDHESNPLFNLSVIGFVVGVVIVITVLITSWYAYG